MRLYTFVVLLAILGTSIAGNYPRADALGGAGILMNESGAFLGSNPAGFSFSKNHTYYLSFYRPYAGIGDPIGSGALGYGHHFRKFDAGLDLQYFQSKMTYRADFGLTLAKRFNKIAFGLRVHGLMDSYREDNFHYIDGDDPNDPVFDDKSGSFAFTGDFGVFYSLSQKMDIALLAENLADPNTAISTTGESNQGRSFDAGLSYRFDGIGTAFGLGGYNTGTADVSKIDFGIGFESRAVHPSLDLRAGFSQSDASLGLGFRLPTDLPLRADYTFSYPLSDLGKVTTSHRFALIGEIEPIIKYPDLSVKITIDRERYPVGDSAEILIVVSNAYLKSPDFVVNLTVAGDTIPIAKKEMNGIGSDEETEWKLRIPLDIAKKWDFAAKVDPADEIVEKDEDNNTATISVNSFEIPELIVSATPNVLKIQTVDYVYQDESIVPAVFFETGSAKIDERFDPLLDLLAERLFENPDAIFIIDGYFDPETETGLDKLADERAQNLLNAIISRNPDIKERVRIGEFGPGEKRVDRISQYPKYQEWINEENRRAEISVKMPEIQRDIDPLAFSNSNAAEIAAQIEPYLHRNPLAVGVIRSSETGRNLADALDNGFSAKTKLLSALPPELQNQILAGASESVEEGKTVFLLSAEGILYRPKEIHSALNFEPQIFNDCDISLEVDYSLTPVDWGVYLAEPDGRPLFDIGSGSGAPPKTIEWDWRDSEGGLLPFGKKFAICLTVSDEFGRVANSCTEGIGTEVTRLEERTDRLLLVQFTFDAPAAQSHYLQDRLEEVARHIIEHGSQPGVTLTAELQGHTDEIGGERRNNELSEERAISVESRMRAYMRSILELPTEEALDKWMSDNDISIVSKGYGDAQPYILDLWLGGSLQQVMVGNNLNPEGRNINRRVLVVIHETHPKGGENE